ncbi:hypothetical protein KZY98_14895, partial [Croceibacter atlanticus]|uniref:hypothetical protein n=1 Tax=Croceibacter atlanticus TaxID=313588 RepID=UPI001C5EF03F
SFRFAGWDINAQSSSIDVSKTCSCCNLYIENLLPVYGSSAKEIQTEYSSQKVPFASNNQYPENF